MAYGWLVTTQVAANQKPSLIIFLNNSSPQAYVMNNNTEGFV